jgi:hypothetical protein
MRRRSERDAAEAIAMIHRQAQNVLVMRTVRFWDGSELAVPEDLALSALVARDCRSG